MEQENSALTRWLEKREPALEVELAEDTEAGPEE